MKIPLAKPALGGKEIEFATEAIRSSQISGSGKFIDQMEKALTVYAGREYCVAVANGTVALHLALLALEIGSGDEVIIPDFGYVAYANSILYVGAIPVLVDIEGSSWGIDPIQVLKKITPKTKAIIIVHNYGLAGDIDALLEISKKFNIKIIEDAAEGISGKYKNKMMGSFGDISTFSFFGNKILTSGEGGAVLTDKLVLDQKIRLLRGQGMDPARRYWFSQLGYNYRLSNLQASIFCSQFQQRDGFVEKRKIIFGRYIKIIREIGSTPFSEKKDYAPWLFTFLLNKNLNRNTFASYLSDNGIETRPTFHALHTLPEFNKYSLDSYPTASDVASRGISLPTFVDISDEEILYITDVINKFVETDNL